MEFYITKMKPMNKLKLMKKYFFIIILMSFLYSCEDYPTGSGYGEQTDKEFDPGCLEFEKITLTEKLVFYDHIFANNGYIFATTTKGIYKSTDNGETWQYANLKYGSNNDAFFTPDDVFYVTYGWYIFKSTDYGDTWTQFDFRPVNQSLVNLRYDNQSTLYAAGVNTNQLYFSSDGLKSWDSIGFNETVFFIDMMDSLIFLNTRNNDSTHLFIGLSGKNDFKEIGSFKDGFALEFVKARNGKIYFLVNKEIFQMDPVNYNFKSLNHPKEIDGYFTGFSNLNIDSQDNIYMMREASYPAEYYPAIVYYSSDYGNTWHEFGPSDEYIYDIGISPSDQIFISAFNFMQESYFFRSIVGN